MWGPQMPKELGGLGLGLVEHGLVSERLGRTPLGHYVFGCQAPDAGNMEILHKYGTAEQKARWLEPLARGEIRSCFSMTEPEHAGSNPTLLSCTRACATATTTSSTATSGSRRSADGAAFAIVMAVTNPDAPPHARASMIIVPTDTPGLRAACATSRSWATPARAGPATPRSGTATCACRSTNRLGAEGAGFLIAQERLGPGRIHHCMRWIGICERAFDMMCSARHAPQDRRRARRSRPRQIVQAWIAEAAPRSTRRA